MKLTPLGQEFARAARDDAEWARVAPKLDRMLAAAQRRQRLDAAVRFAARLAGAGSMALLMLGAYHATALAVAG